MENMYGIGVANRYALFLEIEDPLEILKVQEREKEAKKKTKLSEKENKGKSENKGKAAQPAKKGAKDAQNVKTLVSNKVKEDTNKAKIAPLPTHDKSKENIKFTREEDWDNELNEENKSFVALGDFSRDSWDGDDVRGKGQGGGWVTGRGRGSRGGTGGGGRRVYDNRGKREFDRQSGSGRTGVKPMDMREGAHNWSNPKDEIIEEVNTPSQLPEETEEWVIDDNIVRDAPPAMVEPAVFKEPDVTADAETENAQPVEEELRELTLDEYYALRGSRQKPTYNLRKPGEGEDLTRWKKMYVLKKNKEEHEEEDESEEYDMSEYPQRVGRQKYLLDIDIRFADSPRGRGRGRGGPRGGGRGGPRGRESNESGKTVNQDLENLVLDDEPDTRLEQGTLSFNEAPGVHSQASAHIKSWARVPRGAIHQSPVLATSLTNGAMFVNPVLKFEVVSARTVDQENEKKHVAYTIMVRKDGVVLDPNPAVIERRYSDFLELYESLRRDFPQLMAGMVFPKKVLLGNFAPGVISQRSAGFEGLLEHLASEQRLRESVSLTEFLQGRERREAQRWMEAQRFDQAVPLLENMFRLLNKLHTDRHPAVMLALCRLVACSHADPTAIAPERFADLALCRYEAVSDADLLQFYVPLLQLCVRLWWTLGRDKRPLETRLTDLKRRGIKVDGCPTLLDALMTMDKAVL